MKEDVKALWVAALRSGEYDQGTGALHKYDDTYCCLGVLCEVAVKAGVAVRVRGDEAPESGWLYGSPNEPIYNYQGAYLPEVVSRWAGTSKNPMVNAIQADAEPEEKPHLTGLSSVNDSYGRDFNYIADRIEADL